MGRHSRLSTVVAGLGAVGVAAACTTSGSGARPTRIVTVVSTPTASSTAGTSGTASTASSAATASPTPTPTHVSKLPGSCDTLLPLVSVQHTLGRAIAGKTAFVVGKPEADIGRLSYLNCRYGIGAGGTPTVEIGVSLYGTPAQAAARIPATVTDYVNHGASQSPARVGDQTATILTGGTGPGFTAATIAVASGQRTIAISVAGSAASTKGLVELAKLALAHTGG